MGLILKQEQDPSQKPTLILKPDLGPKLRKPNLPSE